MKNALFLLVSFKISLVNLVQLYVQETVRVHRKLSNIKLDQDLGFT